MSDVQFYLLSKSSAITHKRQLTKAIRLGGFCAKSIASKVAQRSAMKTTLASQGLVISPSNPLSPLMGMMLSGRHKIGSLVEGPPWILFGGCWSTSLTYSCAEKTIDTAGHAQPLSCECYSLGAQFACCRHGCKTSLNGMLIQVACAAAALACMGIPDLRWKAVLFVYLPFRDAEFVQPWLDSYLDLEMWWSLCPEASCVV